MNTKSRGKEIVVTLFYPDKRNIKYPRRLDEKFSRANIPNKKFFIVPHLKDDSEKIIAYVKITLFVLALRFLRFFNKVTWGRSP